MNERLRRLQYENAKLAEERSQEREHSMESAGEYQTTAPSAGATEMAHSAARFAMMNHQPIKQQIEMNDFYQRQPSSMAGHASAPSLAESLR